MASARRRADDGVRSSFLEALEQVSDAVEKGAGLPTVVRAISHALNASVVVKDPSGGVLAVARLSPEDGRVVAAGEDGTERFDLRAADERCGEMMLRARGAPPPASLVRTVATLLALEVDRVRAPARATEAAVGDFLSDLLARKLIAPEQILARADELGCELRDGAGVIVARARPQHAEEGDWRARVLTTAERGARSVERTSLAAAVELSPARPRSRGPGGEPRTARPERDLVLLVPGHGPDLARRAAASVAKEMEVGLTGFSVVVGLSRPKADLVDLHRAGAEALLAANVAEARGLGALAFEETGSYKLLLHAMSEDAAELQRFYEQTAAPLVDYDEQYATDLVRTLEAFLDADGSVARTAERLFTHRHTIRYRLDRVHELSKLDVGTSEGRESLSLGLKAMRVLGVVSPGAPTNEPGTAGGRVPRGEKDR